MLQLQALEISSDTYTSRASPGSTIARLPLYQLQQMCLLLFPCLTSSGLCTLRLSSRACYLLFIPSTNIDSLKVMLLSTTVWGIGEPETSGWTDKSWRGCGLKSSTFESLQTGPETCGATFALPKAPSVKCSPKQSLWDATCIYTLKGELPAKAAGSALIASTSLELAEQEVISISNW